MAETQPESILIEAIKNLAHLTKLNITLGDIRSFPGACLLYVAMQSSGTKEDFLTWCDNTWELVTDPDFVTFLQSVIAVDVGNTGDKN